MIPRYADDVYVGSLDESENDRCEMDRLRGEAERLGFDWAGILKEAGQAVRGIGKAAAAKIKQRIHEKAGKAKRIIAEPDQSVSQMQRQVTEIHKQEFTDIVKSPIGLAAIGVAAFLLLRRK